MIEEVSPGRDRAPQSSAPDLIEPIVAFRSWRVVDGRLRSVYLPSYWTDREIVARCLYDAAPDADAPRAAARSRRPRPRLHVWHLRLLPP